MKRTRKWAFVEQEATRLAKLGLPPQEIAERIGVNRSSVVRWMQSGKLPRTDGESTTRAARMQGKPGQTPEEWAATIRQDYQLDATDEQLVALGQWCLEIAKDSNQKPAERFRATERWQAIVRQLALVARRQVSPEVEKPEVSPAQAQAPVRPSIQRSVTDPRASLLQAVK